MTWQARVSWRWVSSRPAFSVRPAPSRLTILANDAALASQIQAIGVARPARPSPLTAQVTRCLSACGPCRSSPSTPSSSRARTPTSTVPVHLRPACTYAAGEGRNAGACTAAAFLQQFIDPARKWAHVDIAGPAMYSKTQGHFIAGGTGFGVHMLTALAKAFPK